MRTSKYVIYAAMFDFDQTAGNTFTASKTGVSVEEACRMTCQRLFGGEAARIFTLQGGLKNRPVREIVRDVLRDGSREAFIARAKAYFEKHRADLEGFVPKGLGAQFEWNGDVLSILTELFVRTKLRILMSQIGTPSNEGSPWPHPCEGFVELWRKMLDFNLEADKTGVKFIPAIISSGHDHFIDQCFETWGLPAPDLKVTDDAMRSSRCHSMPHMERTKPFTGPFKVFCEDLLAREGDKTTKRFETDPMSCLDGRGFYAGDCIHRDGGLARNLDLCFLWFNPEGRDRGDFKTELVNVTDWSALIEPLFSGRAIDMMRKGLPFTRISTALLS